MGRGSGKSSNLRTSGGVISPAALRVVLSDPVAFSAHILRRPLRPYQVEIAGAVRQAVVTGEGGTISVMISRQGGKNELSAHLECYFLNLFQRVGGNIVKCAPTFKPQVINSKQRLEQMLNNPLNRGRWQGQWSYIVRLGEAGVMFFSAEASANVVGATAHICMEFDEAQDISIDKHDKDFMPMAASTNCPRLYWGTAWDERNLLERMKAHNLELEKKDGRRRHFQVPWWVVAESNPAYGRYVEAEKARLGEDHPMFRTQYKLETIGGVRRFFSTQQRALLRGEHMRQSYPSDDMAIVAGIDIAGADEQAADVALRSLKPRKDSTTVTICRLDYSLVSESVLEPRLFVLDHYYWTGRSHRQQYEQLLAIVRDLWHCQRVVVDATGIGAGIADFLASALGQHIVEQYVFTSASKSRLGFALLAAVNSGRLKMYVADGSEECEEFWRQTERAEYAIHGQQSINFYVPESEGHDDFLMSLALAVHAGTMHGLAPAGVLIERPDDEVYNDGRF